MGCAGSVQSHQAAAEREICLAGIQNRTCRKKAVQDIAKVTCICFEARTLMVPKTTAPSKDELGEAVSNAAETVKGFRDMGLKVLLIGGLLDVEVAHGFAKGVGIASSDGLAFDGSKIDDAIAKVIDGTVISRVTPSQQRDLVNALQGKNEVVMFVGCSPNNVSAMQAANFNVLCSPVVVDETEAEAWKQAQEEVDFMIPDNDTGKLLSAVRAVKQIMPNDEEGPK
mmetsp:Transcript_6127/g.11077  ORF Transcript_6127/g.11077 Transcript_6127/m.11077 type:complete len:226 (+) Transcript_6127:68-745(+)